MNGPKDDNLVRVYRAELHNEHGKITLTSDSLTDARSTIAHLIDDLPGCRAHFEQTGSHTEMVFDRKGGACVGWITEMELPATLVSQVPEQAAA